MAVSLSDVSPELLSTLPEQFTQYFSWFSFAIKTVGIILAGYIILQIVNLVLNIGKAKRLAHMEQKIDSLEQKIDEVLGRMDKKSKKDEKKE